MDSPVFGSQKNKKKSINDVEKNENFMQIKQIKDLSKRYVYAILLVEKNIKKFISVTQKLMNKKKVQTYYYLQTYSEQYHIKSFQEKKKKNQRILRKNSENNMSILEGREAIKIMEVETKLQRSIDILADLNLKSVYRAFTLIYTQKSSYNEIGSNFSSSDFDNNTSLTANRNLTIYSKRTKNPKVAKIDNQQWKQNSALNISELSMQNHKLLQQITVQEAQYEQFTEKMKKLLEEHEKYTSNIFPNINSYYQQSQQSNQQQTSLNRYKKK